MGSSSRISFIISRGLRRFRYGSAGSIGVDVALEEDSGLDPFLVEECMAQMRARSWSSSVRAVECCSDNSASTLG